MPYSRNNSEVVKRLEIYYRFEWEMRIGAGKQVVRTKAYKSHDSEELRVCCSILNINAEHGGWHAVGVQ